MPTGDLAYLIRVGEQTAATGQIPRADFLTYTVSGQPWVNQQWLAALVLYEIHAALGWVGLVMCRGVLVSICYGLTYRRTRGTGADSMVAGTLVLVAFICVAVLPGASAIRPQLLVAPLFLLTTGLLARRVDQPRGLLAVPLIAVVWANMHGSFVLLPVLLGIALLGDISKRNTIAPATGALMVLTLVTPMITPWGSSIYGYIVNLVTSPIVQVIDEWRPIATRWPAGPIFLLTCVCLVVVTWRYGSRRPSVEETLGLLVFTVLTIVSGRNMLWWSLYVPPVVGGLLADWRPARVSSRRVSVTAIGLVAALGIASLVRVAMASHGEALLAEAPQGVTSALEPLTERGRVFAADWGGWFEFALPGVPMFVDSRAEVFPPEIWDQYFEVVAAGDSWRDVLERWDIRAVVLDPEHHPELDTALDADSGWRLAYRDGEGAIYERNEG